MGGGTTQKTINYFLHSLKDEDGETVNLQEKPCASGDCEASEEAAPQDYEYIEKTIDTGAALNTFSGITGFVLRNQT